MPDNTKPYGGSSDIRYRHPKWPTICYRIKCWWRGYTLDDVVSVFRKIGAEKEIGKMIPVTKAEFKAYMARVRG